MINCPFCNTSHVNNTLFCGECGQYLLKSDKPKTDPLNTSDSDWLSDSVENFGCAPAGPQPAISYAIRLKIGARRREVELPLNKAIHMGRVDPTATIFPEIDLTGDGALARSVSRRHARILKQGNAVLIEDLGSVNGTFVNGERLAPYLPETLKDGDTLQLGKLVIGVRIHTQ